MSDGKRTKRSKAHLEALQVGDIVQIGDNEQLTGQVKFIGTTSFQEGVWVGIQCQKAFGKNDGSVQGVRYFECPAKHGLFARAGNLRRLQEGKSTATQHPEQPQSRDGEGEEANMKVPPSAPEHDEGIKELEDAVRGQNFLKLRQALPKVAMSHPEELVLDAWKLWDLEFCRLKEAEVQLHQQVQDLTSTVSQLRVEVQALQARAKELKETPVQVQLQEPPGDDTRELKLTEVDWTLQVPVPASYLRQAVRVEETHRRGVTLQQLKALSELVEQVLESVKVEDPTPSNVGQISFNNANLYHLNELFILRLTQKEVCSFTELVMDAPQDPVWFVSHWWGTPWCDSLAMLGFHSEVHELSDGSPYWICTFANNQHNLEELNKSLLETPFVRAIMSSSCVGTVMLMNENAEPFRRTWCTLENFISTQHVKKKSTTHLFEVAAVVQEGRQKITDGEEHLRVPRCPALLQQGDDGGFVDKVGFEGAWFPNEVACSGVKVDIATADASNQDDKRNILRLIIGETDVAKMPQPPVAHEKYDEVNAAIHRVFAPMALHDAAQDGNVQEVQRLLSAGLVDLAERPTRNSAGETPLFAACANGRVQMVQLLLEKRADVNLTKSDGMSPACAAAAGHHLEVVELLLDGKADLNVASADGGTPLFIAIQAGHYDLVEPLLQARADANGSVQSMQTPVQFLTLALLHKDQLAHDFEPAYEALEKVLRAGAEPDRVNDGSSCSALLAAAVNDSTDALEVLLDAKADPNQRDPEYQATVLSWSAQNANVDAVTALINHRADLNAISGGETPLDIMKGLLDATEDAKACFEVLKSSGAKGSKDLEASTT